MVRSRNIIPYVLICASIVLVMNNLRPHHHHYHQVCFLSGHCAGEDGHQTEGHHHDGFDHSHNHPIDDQCKVAPHYILPAIFKLNGKLICDSQQKELHPYDLVRIELGRQINSTVLGYTILSDKQTGQLQKILIRALRAPPSC